MKSLNILMLLVILYVAYLFCSKKKTKAKANVEQITNMDDNQYVDQLIDEINQHDKEGRSGNVYKKTTNTNFLDTQFHTDYRDVITALNNLVPSQKQLFNLPNQPVQYSEPYPEDVKGMVDDLLNNLNKNIANEVTAVRNTNSGWDEAAPDPNHLSGWEKVQKSLGLPTSLYAKPAKPSPVSLIKIDRIQKYETEDEIKYAIYMILQKGNAKDQMVLKACLVQDKRSLHNEDEFFRTHDLIMRIAIEELFIVGYLSNSGMDANKQFEMVKNKHYDLDNMEYNNLTDPKYIMNELTKRHNLKQREMDYRNALLDEDGQDFHSGLPHPYDYSSYRVTQTIYDDMSKPRTFV